MHREKDISIVVPAFNEEKNLEDTIDMIEGLFADWKDYEILIVDDGSTNYGISAEIIANLFENGFCGDFKRIGAEPVPIPSPKNLENESLVNVRSIITAILELLDE